MFFLAFHVLSKANANAVAFIVVLHNNFLLIPNIIKKQKTFQKIVVQFFIIYDIMKKTYQRSVAHALGNLYFSKS